MVRYAKRPEHASLELSLVSVYLLVIGSKPKTSPMTQRDDRYKCCQWPRIVGTTQCVGYLEGNKFEKGSRKGKFLVIGYVID